MRYRNTPVLLWPVAALFNLIELIVKLTGRLVASIIGLVIMIAGLVLCVTLVGAVAGIPLIIFGFMIMVKGFF